MSDRLPEQDTAWGNMLPQHEGAPNLTALVKALHTPMTSIAAALIGLRSATSLDAEPLPSGERLDLIGSIVGASRDLPEAVAIPFFGFASQAAGRGFGLGRLRHEGEPVALTYTAADQEFRRIIRLKIAINNSHGTATDIAGAARGYYGVENVSVRDIGIAAVEVWVGTIPDPDAPLNRVLPALPVAGGVGFRVVFTQPTAAFGFDGQPGAVGFGQGPLARGPLSNRQPVG